MTTRYFLQIETAVGLLQDDIGAEFAALDAARAATIQSAREIMSQGVLNGKAPDEDRFIIADQEGRTVLSVPFRSALSG